MLTNRFAGPDGMEVPSAAGVVVMYVKDYSTRHFLESGASYPQPVTPTGPWWLGRKRLLRQLGQVEAALGHDGQVSRRPTTAASSTAANSPRCPTQNTPRLSVENSVDYWGMLVDNSYSDLGVYS